VSTRRPILMFIYCACILSLLFPFQRSVAARSAGGLRTSESAQGGFRLTITVREEGGASFSGLATVTLQHHEGSDLSTGTTMGGQVIFDGLGTGEYMIVVTAPGYLTANERMTFTHSSVDEQVTIILKHDSGLAGASAPAGPPVLSPKLQKELARAADALQTNKLEEAQKHVDAAYRLAPGNPEVNYIRGLLADRRGNMVSAQSSWEKTLSLDPKHSLALQALATVAARKGNYAAAQGYLERALQVNPDSWHALELLSIVCFRQANYAEAVSHAERSLELGKNLANGARLPLAESLIAQNQVGAATEVLRAFLNANPPQAQAAFANKLLQKPSVMASAAQASPESSPAVASLPELPLLKPEVPRWLPVNIDEFQPAVEPGGGCPLQEILDGTANHVREFMKSVDRITATELLDHEVVNDWGFVTRNEKRSFNYLVSISEIRPGQLSVEEYRNGTRDPNVFPDAIATTGLSAAVLVFHPYYRDDYEMRCEGLGRWKGNPSWQMHFSQKPGRPSRLRGYRASVGGPLTPIAVKGRAWVEKDTLQVVRMETDLQTPLSEIKLLAEHIDIEFGPVTFRNKNVSMWLPMTADIYIDLRGRRIRRKNAFSNYLLFSVDEKQNISAPGESKTDGNSAAPATVAIRPL
jgi:tetratricopeptide (TPR) repeat protein